MSKQFAMPEWTAGQHSRNSTTNYSRPSYDTFSIEEVTTTFRFRQRLNSLPLTDDLADRFTRMSTSEKHTSQEEGKRKGLRGFLRRASISLRPKARRHSHAVEERPSTAWGKLKSAASFQRHSKFLQPHFDAEGPVDSHETLTSPIPSVGGEPPIIPRGSGGAAARATAALQNEYYFGRMSKHFEFLGSDDQIRDYESGIGISAISTYDETMSYHGDKNIPRVDFLHSLPEELAIQILSHLDHRALNSAARVSKEWARLSDDLQIWKRSFFREKLHTYATSGPIQPGKGLGLPPDEPETDWKDLYRIKQKVEENWAKGISEAVYLHGHLDSIYCLQFDEFKIITGSRDKTIRVWDIKTYECKLVIGPHDIVAKSNMHRNAEGSVQHYSILQETEIGQRIAESFPDRVSWNIFHAQSILCLQYDEKILITGSSDNSCIVHDINDGYKPIRRLVHHTSAVLDLAFDDRHIVTCSKDVTLCVWDRETGTMLKQLRGHTGPVNAVQLRGNTIVSCSGDFHVKLWNIDTGKNIRELVGHTKGLACSQFSEDSRLVASAGNDKVIRIWDANTGECLKKIDAHDNLVRSLHIDSVTGRLISGSYDQDIKVWDMHTGDLLLEFPKWHASWVLGTKSDYRRIVSTGQDAKILILDFGSKVAGIEKLESANLNARQRIQPYDFGGKHWEQKLSQ